MADPNIVPLPKETLIKMLENSVGSRLFNSLFVLFKDKNAVKDILNDGEFSCAFFISSILVLGGYVPKPVATVVSLQKKLEEQGWQRILDVKEAAPGDIIFWEKIKFEDGSENAHVGFVLNDSEAVSTDYKQKCVVRHPLAKAESTGERKVEAIFRLPA
jgi:hypothetical protein